MLAQDKGNGEELIVQYTRFPELLQGEKTRSPVSIVSGTDGTVYYDKGKAQFRAEMVLFAVVVFLMLVFLIPAIWLFFDGPVKRLRTRLRQKRRRQQKNKT